MISGACSCPMPGAVINIKCPVHSRPPGQSDNPVVRYCVAFSASQLEPAEFARHMMAKDRPLCLLVMETIGSWPSSERELAALQRAFA